MGWERSIALSWNNVASKNVKDSIFIWFLVSSVYFLFINKFHIQFYFIIIYYVLGLFVSSIFIGLPVTAIGYVISTPILIFIEKIEDRNKQKLAMCIFLASKIFIAALSFAIGIILSYLFVFYYCKLIKNIL